MRDERNVHHFLHRVGAQQRKAGLTSGHHVAVITKDRKRLHRQRPRADVKHGREQLAGELVHIGDHQEQALAGGERGGERAGLRRAMHRARRAAFALHLDDRRHSAPDVRLALRRPLIGPFAHGRGRRDGINGDDFAHVMCDIRRRLIRVERYLDSWHPLPP